MSPLLFLAIAIVVPLLGMVVLGVGARIKHQKVTDDETGLFRRKLESIAPPDSQEPPSGTPGLDSEAPQVLIPMLMPALLPAPMPALMPACRILRRPRLPGSRLRGHRPASGWSSVITRCRCCRR